MFPLLQKGNIGYEKLRYNDHNREVIYMGVGSNKKYSSLFISFYVYVFLLLKN